MKTTKFGLAAALTLGSLMAFAPLTQAQQDRRNEDRPRAQRREAGDARPQDRINRMAEELKLTAEQKEKLQAAMREQNEKARTLREDTNLSQEDRRTKMRELRTDFTAKVKKILNAEQFEQWEKLNQGGPRGGRGQGDDRPSGERRPRNNN